MKKILDHFEEILSAGCLLAMTILAFVNVISRFVFKASLSFTDEITTNLFVLLTLAGASLAARRNAHLGLNLVTDNLSAKWQKNLNIIANLLGVLFTGILVYFGVIMAYNEYRLEQLTAGMQLPEWIFGAFVPFGGILLLLRFIQKTIETVKEEV
jgi:C4-dicarboxylate transporter DctQ subunit